MTNPDKVVAMADSLSSLGAELRELRKARNMTLKDLSQLAGISLSHLSAIERGASSPTIDVLGALAEGLEVNPSWFFVRRSGKGPLERAFVVRRQNRRDLNVLYEEDSSELGYTDSLLSSSIGGEFYMGMGVFEPFSETPFHRMQEHAGETHGIVLEGELELRIRDEVITLREGDSYSFDARIPHHATNRTDKICRIVWAVSPVVIPKNSISRKPLISEEQAGTKNRSGS